MCFIEWQPLKPADLAQVVAVPITAWITYKVFRLGERAENRRLRATLAADYAGRCEEIIKAVECDSVKYYTNTNGNDRVELAAKIRLDIKGLSRALGQLAEVCNEKPDFFSKEYGELLAAATGGDFGSKTPKKRGMQDPTILSIHSSVGDLSKRIHARITELLP